MDSDFHDYEFGSFLCVFKAGGKEYCGNKESKEVG